MEQPTCIECRYCEICVSLNMATCYICRKTGDSLDGTVLHRPACGDFQPPL